MIVPEGFTVETYSRALAPIPRQWVAIIGRPGKHGPHLMSFTFAPTEAEAERKALAAIESWLNPAKRSKQPTDLDTVQDALDEEPI